MDGVPIATGPMEKNVLYGLQQVWFTNLIPDTFYYFKMFPFRGTGEGINYKIEGNVQQVVIKTGL